ncbi:hypothetical protein J2Y69_000364 [Microbacterium resistens]|uniref:Peptidase inhibitor family I36 n=1 Tax=Microbacterium resistens TaxID=156977 RepID=A0ABU1S831_9MICO|nr:hypothetical protein [Microbacterium resistens]MDR6865782.1 hypothetical protein [Microbacterium resistens]
MKKSIPAGITLATVAGLALLGAAPANAAATCYAGNICSYDGNDFGGTMWAGAATDFVEVPDDVTNSTDNNTSRGYNAQNNTAWGQEQTIMYISAGGEITTYSGNNNVLDHYRA